MTEQSGPSEQTVATDPPVRIGIVGTSWIAAAFVEAARTVDGIEITAVCSRTAASADRFADRLGIPRRYTDLAALGEAADVDGVYIASPNSEHAPQAIALLEAGKHVLVEKPMAISAAQAEAMIEAARTADRVLMEAYVTPYEPNVAAIRAALPQLGRLRRAVLMKSQYSSKYDALKGGELPNAFNPEFGGGALMDLGFYQAALAVHLFGEPASVVATGQLLDSGVDGQATFVLDYDGFEVIAIQSKVAPTALGSEIAGEDGVLSFDDSSVPSSVRLAFRKGAPGEATAPGFTRPPEGVAAELAPGQSEHHMRYEAEEFARLIREGGRESRLHPTSASLATLRILDAAREQVGVRFPGA